MSFCTAINCMDGRVQRPVVDHLTEHLGVDHVDMITEPGPNRILAERTDQLTVDSICRRVDVSVGQHGSRAIAVIGHHDCAGNPAGRAEQAAQTAAAVALLAERYPQAEVFGLWVNEDWQVEPGP
jgi:carbonic anhydrase